jgi:1,5-anhydro-D-fructose reductase (1,5-anhydro-D-mannitol-forming)
VRTIVWNYLGVMKVIKGEVHWGIIGCGDVCEVKSGPAFNKVPGSKLVAVMRRDLVKAKDYAKRHGVPMFYDDAKSLIHDPGVNAIYIATPPSSHEAYTIAAIEAGKPVYVEKPVTVDSDSCRRMARASAEAKIPVSVAHYRRGLPLFRKVKSLVAEGVLGNIRLVRLTCLQPVASNIITATDDNWRLNSSVSGGGLFHDLSPHQLDIVYWIFGRPIQVSGKSYNQAGHYSAPDLTTLEAEFNNKVVMQGAWGFTVAESAAQEFCEVVGDKGMIRFSFFRKSTIELTTNERSEVLEFDYPLNIQHPMIESVTRYFRGEVPNPCSLEEAEVVMSMMDATLASQ